MELTDPFSRRRSGVLCVLVTILTSACAEAGEPSVDKRGVEPASASANMEETLLSAFAAEDAGTGAAGAPSSPRGPAAPLCQNPGASAWCTACTEAGVLAGAVQDSTCAYLGVPYAKPPVGRLRFAPPERADRWIGIREARAFGAACIQGGFDVSGAARLDEDCLYLNVWTPRTTPAKPLPVLVFIHGGGYVVGGTNLYDATGLSEQGPAVVVSMNYRLGALGFFAHPELDAQRSGQPSGADGIRDQQLALHWVHDNIAAFHGDPNNVTVFGESAGSSSVGVHLVSPGTRGLAHRFIMESGVPTRAASNLIGAVPRERMYRHTEQMIHSLCPFSWDVISCLRWLPADVLMQWAPSENESPRVSWAPVVEGPGGVLPDTPDALLASGATNRGELIIGSNRNEWAMFMGLGEEIPDVGSLRTKIAMQFPDSVDKLMSIYAPNASVDAYQAYITLMTDAVFRCPARGFARLASGSDRGVYLYSFEQGAAPHASELQYVFNYGLFTLTQEGTPPTPSVVKAVQGYWLNFARTGDPNGTGLTPWPEHAATTDQHMRLVEPTSVGTGLQKAGCDFWDQYLVTH